MRISKIHVPIHETKKVNLKEIDLTKKQLGSTVALVGKNGAGKSRVLKFVESYFEYITPENFLDDYITSLPKSLLQGNLSTLLTNARRAYKQSLSSNNLIQQRQQQVSSYTQHAHSVLQKLKQLGGNFIKVVDNDDLKQIKDTLANNLTFEQILSNSYLSQQSNQQIPHIINEFAALNSQTTIRFFNKLSTELVTDEFNLYLENRNNPLAIQEKISQKKSHILFSNFQQYVWKFLGKEFSYQSKTTGETLNSILYFNGNPFDINLLSPGQKTLFAYAILFFILDTNSQTNIKDSIIIIDEPEKHLHPDAQILLISALKEIVSNSGQLWIATHSINILAHLEYDEIIMLKDDEIIPPSRTTPGNSFNDLMGLDDHISELMNFITSISEWAFGNFMVQCFKEPDVVFNIDNNDPQYVLFKNFLSKKQRIDLLDFGAGKGRIGYTICEDEQVNSIVQYSAYEPDNRYFEQVIKVPNIQGVYRNVTDIPENSFDCILLCNVLHEINPKEWVETFNHIKKKLKPDGLLLIIEDKFLPKGEKAHEFGYLILDTVQLRLLFKSNYNTSSHLINEFSLADDKYRERILFVMLTKAQINPTDSNVREAIKSIRESSFNNLKVLRRQDKDINQGRQYANQAQLYINAQLALEALK